MVLSRRMILLSFDPGTVLISFKIKCDKRY